MVVLENVPVLSNLPNLDPPVYVSNEKKNPKGFWYGFTQYHTKECLMTIAHKAFFNTSVHRSDLTSKQILSRQQVTVLVYFEGEETGSARFRPYAVEDGGLSHPGIWSVAYINVMPHWQRQGVAKAIYSHMKAFGYQLSPAPVIVSQKAMDMWEGFDPRLSFNDSSSSPKKITCADPMALPIIADWDQEVEQVKSRFAPVWDLDIFVKEHLPKTDLWLQAISSIEMIIEEYFEYPDEALLRMISKFSYSTSPKEIDLLKDPNLFGINKFLDEILLRRLSPKARKWEQLVRNELYSLVKDLETEFCNEKSNFYNECIDNFGLFPKGFECRS